MEKLERNTSDPLYVADNPGMNADQAKAFAALAGVVVAAKAADPRLAMAKTIATQTGKTVEEVLAFMGPAAAVPVAPVAPAPVEIFEEETLEEIKDSKPAKVAVPIEAIPDEDKFIVTEVVNLEDASEADLDKIAKDEEDEENDWSGKIRVGSKVKIVFQVSASRINWVGKKGKVVRIVGNESAKVYDVEFTGGKILKVRLNKKTNKLERGYIKKVIRNTFSEDQVALVD
jgi:hypothetical protein